MKLVRRLVTLVWVTTLLVIGCVLYLFNSDPVDIDLVWLQIPETSLAVVLLTTFFFGFITGSILVLIASMLPRQRKSVDA
ncbi:MAG: LapA family protein [Pseudomonadota bacterium]|nr:LapA family protein [Pseudomonadota bacterium]